MTGRILLYYKYTRHKDRWVRGDRHVRQHVRRLVRGPAPIGGIDLVFLNLCAGLDRLKIEYHANLPFSEIRADDKVGVIGRDRESMEGYDKLNPVVAGVAVTQHPDEWPTLFEDYPISRYVVHCDWVADMFRKVYGDRVSTWAVGIDTQRWAPTPAVKKSVDLLIYDKVRWDHDRVHAAMVEPIRRVVARAGLTTETIRYGAYKPHDLAAALSRAKAFLFLCEHETQGLAYQQAMAAGLPVLAWDPGQWLDPSRFRYSGNTVIPATSVPFFDDRCGLRFRNFGDFPAALERFMNNLRSDVFAPRDYVDETLTLEICAKQYLKVLDEYA